MISFPETISNFFSFVSLSFEVSLPFFFLFFCWLVGLLFLFLDSTWVFGNPLEIQFGG